MQRLRDMGCDGVIAEDLDCYSQDSCVQHTGGAIELFKAAVDYTTWMADKAHEQGLAFGQVDAPGVSYSQHLTLCSSYALYCFLERSKSDGLKRASIDVLHAIIVKQRLLHALSTTLTLLW